MADPILYVRCPKRSDTSKPHLAVDVHQPLTPSKMAAVMGAVGVCSCGAETVILPKSEVRRG